MTLEQLLMHRSGAPDHPPVDLWAEALELLLPFLDDRENPQRRKLRLIGVRAEKLSR